MWNSINRGWFQRVWWMKSSICPLVPVMFHFPGAVTLIVEDQHSVSPQVIWRQQISLSCCYRISVHLLCHFSTLCMFPRNACCICITSSVISLTVLSITSRQCALCLILLGDRPRNGQESNFSTSWTYQFSTVLPSSPFAVRNDNTEISDMWWSGA
jgi:hypothetical protein